jgi:hypothetical protein
MGVDFDRNIEHYRSIAATITDQAMLRGIDVLIDRAKARKASYAVITIQAAVGARNMAFGGGHCAQELNPVKVEADEQFVLECRNLAAA